MKFPKQNIPEEKKTEEWHKACLDAVLQNHKGSNKFTEERVKDYENYLLVHGQFDAKQFKYVTDMYGITAPARLVNYPIIMPKIDLLVGEVVSQPLRWSVNVVNKNAIRRKNEKKVQIAAEVLLRPHRREIEKVLGSEISDQEVGAEVPKDIESFQNMKFRDAVEEQVHVGLQYIAQKQKLKSIFKRGFYDLAITGKEFYRVIVKNRDPFIERIDPRTVIYDIDSDKETLQDCKYAGLDNWYTVNEIVDRFQLEGSVIDELEKLENMEADQVLEFNSAYDAYMTSDSKALKIRVVEIEWKSLKTIKYKVSPNKYDEEIDYYKMVKDDYVPKDGENVVKRVINDVRYCIQVGHKIILKFGRRPNIIRHEDNYANCKLSFFGVIRNAFNQSTLSVVDSLKNIQLLYNIVNYHIELALARSGGKALVYDVAQKPKGMKLNDVLYHLKNSGLAVINTNEEGMQTRSFNQFQQVDLTLSQSVGQLINLKVMLEQTADQLTGITASRAGITKSSDAVGVNERSVMQSTLITAPLFDIHYELIGDTLNAAANLFRYCWADDDRMMNIFGDMGIEVFKWEKTSALDEIGLFVENSAKELSKKQSMYSMMDRMASTGSLDPLSTMKALNAESAVEVEKILTEGIEVMQQKEQANQESMQQIESQKNEIEAQKMQVPIEVAKINSETDIRVAEMKINADQGKLDQEQEFNSDSQSVQQQNELDKMMLQNSNTEEEQMMQQGMQQGMPEEGEA
tara:strand:+ start:28977 stop:31202 length:2226 start_codon:yes stop_codon:yes gene_type:complete